MLKTKLVFITVSFFLILVVIATLYTTYGVEFNGYKIGLQTYRIDEPQLTPYNVGNEFSVKSNMDMNVVWELDNEPLKEEFGVKTSSFHIPDLSNSVRDTKGNVVQSKLGTKNHILILRYNDGVKTWII